MQNGIFLILLSMSLTPFGDALSKQLTLSQAPVFIVFLRYLTAGLIALFLLVVSGQSVDFPRENRFGLIVRTALVMGAMLLLVVSLSMAPLASAVGGFLIAPIVAMLISGFVFREPLTVSRVLGAALSFGGALVIPRPDAGIETGVVVALAGGGLLGTFLALTRTAPAYSSSVSALAIQCLMGAAMLFPFAVFNLRGLHVSLLVPAVGLGLVTAATHFLTVAAYQRAESTVLAPFFYFNLVAAVVIGALLFGETPDWVVLVGLFLIAAGGCTSQMNLLNPRIKSERGANPDLAFRKTAAKLP